MFIYKCKRDFYGCTIIVRMMKKEEVLAIIVSVRSYVVILQKWQRDLVL